MTLSLRAGLALMATTAVLAGCSTAPTITVPNPMAAFNGVFTAPRVATVAPGYTPGTGAYRQAAPATYVSVSPDYNATTSYGAVDQGYSLQPVDTGLYSMESASAGTLSLGTVAPSYSTGYSSAGYSAGTTTLGGQSYAAAPSFGQGSYTLGSVGAASAPSYATGVPMLGSVAPSYSAQPMMETATYATEVATYSAPTMAGPSYSGGFGVQNYGTGAVQTGAVQTGAMQMGAIESSVLQPVQASGTTYDLTVPSAMETMGPATGIGVNTGSYATYAEPEVSMGGSFQVVPTPSTGGVATYSSAPTVTDGGTFTY